MKRRGSSSGKAFLSKKRFAVVEIALVLCLLFLAALPAAASEDDCIDIYGNANEDNALNVQDVTYIKRIIYGEESETALADANYDGEIDVLDLVQTKLIILGRAGRLTIIDSADRAVTLDMPIESVVALSTRAPLGTLRVLEAGDKIVGINGMVGSDPFYSEFLALPSVGWPEPDYEAIVDLAPDLIVASTNPYLSFDIVERMEPYGIKVALLDCGGEPVKYSRELRILGVILVNQERANEYIDFLDSNFNRAQEKLEELTPEKKKTIYFEFDVWEDVTGYQTETVEPEEVSYRDPDVILKDPHSGTRFSGFADGVIENMEESRDDLMTRPWGNISAAGSGEVYVVASELGNERTISTCFLAKLLYPDLMSEVDTGAILEEYLEEYHGKDYDEYQAVIYHPTKSMK
jgi:iron complex transport system substrate-binding protein